MILWIFMSIVEHFCTYLKLKAYYFFNFKQLSEKIKTWNQISKTVVK